jgi:uncharacterized protein YcnI
MKRTLVVLALFALGLVPVAAAHVEPSPEQVPANSTSKITLSVEGEENVPAIELAVQMPSGVTKIVAHPTKGWKQSVTGRIVMWKGGKIPHGAEGKFAFTAHMPNTPGRVLVFPALVAYQDGKVVHWIGAESSDTPAPRVTLTAAAGQAQPPPPAPVATTTATEGDGGSSNTWIWIVIVAAIGGALAAILVVRHRKRT